MRPRMILKDSYLLIRDILLWLIFRPGKGVAQGLIIKSILAIRIDRIGDLIVSIPALKALREYFPEAKIYVLVRKENESLLKGAGFVDEIIVYSNFFSALKILRRHNFDLAIDLLMDYPIKSTLLAYFSHAKIRAGFVVTGKRRLFDVGLKPEAVKKRLSEHTLDLIGAIIKVLLGKDVPLSLDPYIFISEEDKKDVKLFLKENRISENELLIGIHPGGHYPAQRWPIENFNQFANGLVEKFKAKIIVMGSYHEGPLVDKMMTLMDYRGVVKTTGLPLDRLASLISLMDVFICNNSGPLHIAVAVNTPTVSTMGPTDPILWRPMGKNHIVIKKDLPCSPCNRARCKNHDCMKLISVSEMMDAVEKQLGRIGKRAQK